MPKTEKQLVRDQSPVNLYVSVKTFEGSTGKMVNERVVDMHHFGTNSWLLKHQWWAMHNSMEVELKIATDAEVEAYIENAKRILALKFSNNAGAEKQAA